MACLLRLGPSHLSLGGFTLDVDARIPCQGVALVSTCLPVFPVLRGGRPLLGLLVQSPKLQQGQPAPEPSALLRPLCHVSA